jgi:hypothetical protein
VQYRPDAAEFLDAVAELLEDDVLAAVPPHLQHRVRVAANICRILEREADLGPTAARDERVRLVGLLPTLGVAVEDPDDLVTMRAALAARLDDDRPFTAEQDRAVYDALLATVRDDLQICKPGYDELGGAA